MEAMNAFVKPASADVSCGDTLGPGKKYKLEADLTCAEGDILTLRDNASLDLNGHVLVTTVVLAGRKASISNGIIEGRNLCGSYCLILEGQGGHVVANVNIIETSFGVGGVLVDSDNNRLSGNTTLGDRGFDIQGSNNVIIGNIAFNGSGGI
jgi:hypothetical protein